jgi:hypothetical protein
MVDADLADLYGVPTGALNQAVRRAHLLLQMRCAVLNGEDLLGGFRRWFPTIGEPRIMLPWDWLPQQYKRFQSTTRFKAGTDD